MEFPVFAACAVALFAVFGFYCAIRTVTDLLFPSRRLSVAVEVRDKKDAEQLDMLLEEAAVSALQRGTRLVVLLSTDLMDGTVGVGDALFDSYDTLLERFGAECYLIDP